MGWSKAVEREVGWGEVRTKGLCCRRVSRRSEGEGVGEGARGRRGMGEGAVVALWGGRWEGVVWGKISCILCIIFVAYRVQNNDGVGLCFTVKITQAIPNASRPMYPAVSLVNWQSSGAGWRILVHRQAGWHAGRQTAQLITNCAGRAG